MSHVSVVIPLYNAEDFIGPCVESVLGQTYSDWELIIVDDGSTDRSAAIADKYAREDSRIRLLHHPQRANRGVSLTRRRAMDECTGEFIALLDADDVYLPNKLELQVALAVSYPECVVFHSRATGIDAAGEDIRGKNPVDAFNKFARTSTRYGFRELGDFLKDNKILNSSALIRGSVLREVPYGFPQLFQYEDWTLWTLLSGCGPFYVQSETLVQYRIHDQSATSRVAKSELVAAYSYVEFLLSTMALVQDQAVRLRASELLAEHLAIIVAKYGAVASSVVGGASVGSLSAEQLVNLTKSRKQKWYRKFLRKNE